MANDKKDYILCTCCGKEKQCGKFYESQSELYKSLGYLPICKDCIGDIYKQYEKKYKDDKEIIYNFCRLFDLPFSNSDFDGAVQHSKKTNWKLYQSYFKQINSFGEVNSVGRCFEDSEKLYINNNDDNLIANKLNIDGVNFDTEVDEEVQLFWGFGFDKNDYLFLEHELSEWKKTHKCDNQAEITLLKEICIKILEIRKGRMRGESVSKLQKELQDLMKTASVDPAKANAISDGQTVDRFGVWIKDIEQYRPAEWWDKQEKYVDMDGFKPYIKNYIVRPIKNFFTGTKNFIIGDEDLSLEEDKNE